MAASMPWMTLPGKYFPTMPARAMPSTNWAKPPMTTAKRKASNPTSWMPSYTITASPAAGPDTPTWLPEMGATMMPPMMPAIKPAMGAAPEARAMPRQRGRATRKTTMEEGKSRPMCWNMEMELNQQGTAGRPWGRRQSSGVLFRRIQQGSVQQPVPRRDAVDIHIAFKGIERPRSQQGGQDGFVPFKEDSSPASCLIVLDVLRSRSVVREAAH